MQVTLVQTASALDPTENRDALARHVAAAAGADLVVLPEAFQRDFGRPGSSLAEHAEPLDGPFVDAVRSAAGAHGTAVLAGMFEVNPDDPARPFNTLVLVDGDALTTYRKVHLYDSFGFRESDVVTGGAVAPVTASVAGVRLGLMTCYDLRFPELARLLVADGAEALVVPAAWVAGERKAVHWTTLLQARAIEDLVYVLGVGQGGDRYTGHTRAFSPYGDLLAGVDQGEHALTVTLDPTLVTDARQANPSLDNRRL